MPGSRVERAGGGPAGAAPPPPPAIARNGSGGAAQDLPDRPCWMRSMTEASARVWVSPT
jgi:hypothetical protein